MRTFLLSLVLAAAVAGCAVMKVDVDVYKGPLSNHEDVQAQQLAVMANAAKPLLIGLRDQVEWGGAPSNAAPYPGYPNYITGDDSLHTTYGKRVNAVLSLYDDRKIDPDLEVLRQQIAELSHRYTGSLNMLWWDDPQDEAADESQWAQWSRALKQDSFPANSAEAKTVASDTLRAQCDAFDKNWQQYLATAFRILLDSRYRDLLVKAHPGLSHYLSAGELYNSYPVRDAMYCVWHNPRALSLTETTALRVLPPMLNSDHPDLSSNAVFEFLANSSKMAFYAATLFKNATSDEAAQFQKRVTEIGNAFWDARQVMQELQRLSLNALLKYPNLRGSLADVIAQVIEPRYLALAVCVNNWDPTKPMLRSDLAAKLAAALPNDIASLNEWDWKPPYAAADRAITDLLLADGPGMVQQIKAADKALMAASADTIDCNPVPPKLFRFALPELYRAHKMEDDTRTKPLLRQVKFGREFNTTGIARGPTLSASSTTTLVQKLLDSMNAIDSAPALGLDRGRLDAGLDSLIDDYQRDSASCRAAPQDSNCARERDQLSDALVGFSEKVLFIANNDVLLAAGDNGKAPPRTIASSPDDKLDRGAPAVASDSTRRPFTLVLQAVGNSILGQLDELKFRHEHEDLLKRRAGAELETLKKAVTQPPKAVFDDLVAGLRADAAAAAADKQTADKDVDTKKAAATKATTDLDAAQKAVDDDTKQKAKANDALTAAQSKDVAITATSDALNGTGSQEAKDDLAKLKKAVIDDKVGGTPTVAGSAMINDITAWLDGQLQGYDSSLRAQPRPARLAAASAYLKSADAPKGPTDAQPRDQAFKAIADTIANNKPAADAAVASAQKDADNAASTLTLAKTTFDKAQSDADTASAALEQARTASDDDKSKQQALSNAADYVSSLKNAVLATFTGGAGVDPQEVYDVVKTQLRAAEDKALTSCASRPALPTAVQKLCDAVTVMAARKAPIGSDRVYTGAIDPTKGEDTRDVLDRMITALQYQRIQVQASGGKAQVDQIDAAISAAFQYRSGMEYLRPSGAYLRNSYPATALQADPGLGWTNMLQEQSMRATPGIGGFLADWGHNADLKIQSQIDKQFWQNINSVRVSGGGKTNYVIAKDDIGNWYVKAYSADKQPIIDAAKSLALFTLGGGPAGALGQAVAAQGAPAAGAAALGAATTPPAGGTTTAPGQTPAPLTGTNAPTPPLDQLFTRHKTKYETQTSADYVSLQKDLAPEQVTGSITALWTKHNLGANTRLQSDLSNAATQLTTTWKAFTDTTKPDEQASRILDGLNSILLFYKTLTKKIAAEPTVPDPKTAQDLTSADLTTAQGDVSQAVSSMLNPMLATRQSAVKDYSTAITFIGEVVK